MTAHSGAIDKRERRVVAADGHADLERSGNLYEYVFRTLSEREKLGMPQWPVAMLHGKHGGAPTANMGQTR
jgi:hypothetical protein